MSQSVTACRLLMNCPRMLIGRNLSSVQSNSYACALSSNIAKRVSLAIEMLTVCLSLSGGSAQILNLGELLRN